MNKNICLLLALLCLATQVMGMNTPQVEYNWLAWRMNFITLFQVQGALGMCFMGSLFSLFWGADKGEYFYRCFNNYVSKPKFL